MRSSAVLHKATGIFLAVLLLAAFLFVPLGIIPFESTAAAAERVTLKVAFPNVEGFSMTDEYGNKSGIVVDYLNEISKYTGWKYEFIDVSSDEVFDRFQNGEFDLLGGQYYLEGLEDTLAYPDYSCGSLQSVLLARWDDLSIKNNDLSDLNGKKIGVYDKATENIERLTRFLTLNGLDCELIYYSYEDRQNGSLFHKLESGEVDLFLGNIGDDNGQLRSVAYFDYRSHYIVAQADNPQIVEQLNSALGKIYESNPNFANEHYHKYFSSAPGGGISLSEEEKKAIEKYSVARIAVVSSLHPLCCLHNDDGGHSGIVPDVLERISEFSGLEFEYVHADSYSEALKLVKNGDADILGFFLGTEQEALNMDLALTIPFTHLDDLVVCNSAVSYPSESLSCGLLAGREGSTAIHAESFTYFEHIEDALVAVNKGKVDFIYGFSAIIEGAMQKGVYANISPVSVFGSGHDISFAIPIPADTTLLSIMNKSLSHISSDVLEGISSSNLIVAGQTSFSLQNFIYANPIASVALVTAVLLLIIISLVLITKYKLKTIQAKNELERTAASSRAKSQFLSQMSHEIRTPLNGIIGMAEIGRMYLNDTIRVSNCLDKISSSSQHLLALVNDVLDMSKIESGKASLHHDVFDFGQLLRSLVNSFLYQAKLKNISLGFFPSGDLDEELMGDELRLTQILTNLMSNAIKFTPDGGSVSLHVGALNRTESRLRISFDVIDTGCGIAQSNISRIFRPFEQEYTGTNRQYGGTGLGLPITQQFVQMMDGRITVSSKEGVGSAFHVEIPFKLAEKRPVEIISKDKPLLIYDPTLKNIDTAHLVQFYSLLHKEKFVVTYANSIASLKEVLTTKKEANEVFSYCFLYQSDFSDLKEEVGIIREYSADPCPKIILFGIDKEELEELQERTNSDAVLCVPIFHRNLQALFTELESPPAPKKEEKYRPFEKKNVLVVEDNLINQEIAVTMLENSGAHIDVADNGMEALEIFKNSNEGYYDLILMDMQMPVMDGCTATRKIRALKRTDAKSTLIIAMTANVISEDIAECLGSGMDAHIPKPFSQSDIINTYFKAIEEQREYIE